MKVRHSTSALDLKNHASYSNGCHGCSVTTSRQDGLTVIFTTHHPHHALAVADEALLMRGTADYDFGVASEVLSEEQLTALYGSPIKRFAFEFEGRRIETLAPVLRSHKPIDF